MLEFKSLNAPKAADMLAASLREKILNGHFDDGDDLPSERVLVEQYLRLEALRLEDRLDVCWDVDDDVEDYNPWMPGFILQPIVENAIRHGVELHGGQITISMRHAKSYLELVVLNDCPETLVTKKASSGLGLAEQDVLARLRLLYDEQAQYQREFLAGKCRVTIRFPWRLQ